MGRQVAERSARLLDLAADLTLADLLEHALTVRVRACSVARGEPYPQKHAIRSSATSASSGPMSGAGGAGS